MLLLAIGLAIFPGVVCIVLKGQICRFGRLSK